MVMDGVAGARKVAGNQTQIPVIQTDNQDLTQVQQNTNKVLRNLNEQIILLQDSLAQLTIVGEIKFAPITIEQFQEVAGDTWIEANGQSSIGTTYALKFGFNTVPNIVVAGTNAFIKVN